MKESDPQRFIEEGVSKFVKILEEHLADQLKMVALYGSAATGRFVAGVSDINILVITDTLDARHLSVIAGEAKKLLVDHRITVHLLTKAELESSADVFPVEYLEISKTMRLLQGSSLFEDLEIGRQNLRHQIEAMVRGSMNALKQILLLTFSETKLLKRELISWSGRLLPLLRAVLILFGEDTGIYSQDDIGKICAALKRRVGIDCPAFIEVCSLRSEKKQELDVIRLADDLLAEYAALVEAVDACEISS